MQVLLLAGKRPLLATLAEAAAELGGLGAEVHLSCMSPLGAGPDVSEQLQIRDLTALADGQGAEFWRRSFAQPYPVRMWEHVRADKPTLRRGRTADVLVALDQDAVYSVWRLARANRTAQARLGLGPALEMTRELAASGALGRTPDPAPAARAPTAARKARWWSRLPRVPVRNLGSPSDEHAPAPPVVPTAQSAGIEPTEVGVAEPLSPLEVAREHADLLAAEVTPGLAAGRLPGGLAEAIGAELAYADALLESGQAAAAAASFMQACRLGFHRLPQAAQGDGAPQPEVLVRLRLSRTFLALTSGRDRAVVSDQLGHQRRSRALVIKADAELGDLLHGLLRAHVEVRELDASDLGSLGAGSRNPVRLIESVLAGDGRAQARARDSLQESLDWSDVVILDGVTALAYGATLIDTGSSRVAARLRPGDLGTAWPQLLDWSQVQDLFVETESQQALAVAAIPAVTSAGVQVQVAPDAATIPGRIL